MPPEGASLFIEAASAAEILFNVGYCTCGYLN